MNEPSAEPLNLDSAQRPLKQISTKIIRNDYQRADLIAAKAHLQETSITDDEMVPLPLCKTSPHYLGTFGPGIELYFRFIKLFGFVFLFMTILSIPILYFNISGDELEEDETTSQFDQTFISNQDGVDEAVTDEEVAEQQKDDQETAMNATVYLDLSYCVVFFVCYLIIEIWTQRIVAKSRKENTTPSDYSIEVTHLPREGITEEELQTFFEERFSEEGGSICKIKEVAFARFYQGAIGKYHKKAALEKQIIAEEIRCKMKGVESSTTLTKLRLKCEQLQEKLDKVLPNLRSNNELPILKGYLVFDSVKQKINVLESYAKYKRCRSCCPLPMTLRPKEKIQIK
jgi:hypothetical protein